MNQADALVWFQEVSVLGSQLRKEYERHYNQQDVANWVAQATSPANFEAPRSL